jgi:hypothetical protein
MPLQPSPFLDRLVLFLMPYFVAVAPDHATARSEILSTLASYGARTRAELFTAAQVLAFVLSALDVLAEAKTVQEMTATTRLRYRGCANALNRICQQNEKALAKRLACDGPGEAPATPAEEADLQDMLQKAKADIGTYRSRLSGARPATGPNAARKPSAWMAAFADAAAPA